MGELQGRAIVVTGAGQGLGEAYAIAIAKAGGRVVVNDLNAANAEAVAAAIRASGGDAVASSDPVGTAEDADRIVGLCVERFGAIHGLINNAAMHSQRPSGEETPDNVERVLRANILGTWYTGRAAIAAMQRKGGGGVIINTVSGAMLGSPGMAVYSTSKGAVQSMTISWASELDGSGIRVVAISPLARTPMLLGTAGRTAQHGPEVAAPLAVYLLSDASAHLNGHTVRTAEGQISLYRPGSYGPALGSRLDWTSESLAAALGDADRAELSGYSPKMAGQNPSS